MGGKVLISAKTVATSVAAVERLRAGGCELRLVDTPTSGAEAWLLGQVADIDALVVAMEPVGARVIQAAQRLRVIARPGVGYDNIALDACTAAGVAVTAANGANHESVADFTFALLLASARRMLDAVNGVRRGEWPRLIGTEVWNKTLVIVGLGRIGLAVARRALGFSMRVLVVEAARGGPPPLPGVEYVTLEQGLAAADYLSLHVPLTDETRHMLDARRLALLKRGAYIINTARAGLIDEGALIAALDSGHVAGAAIDVQKSPAGPGPLAVHPRVLVTPHMATFSAEAMERVALNVADSILAVLRGERPGNTVNPKAYANRPRGGEAA